MPIFSEKSEERLESCHPDLQKLFYEVIKRYDCTIICGYRGEGEQNKAFAEGNSKLKYPQSKHNHTPSLAVDVMPYPIDWNDTKRVKEFGDHVKRIAEIIGVDITWGGDWKSFKDYLHFELKQ